MNGVSHVSSVVAVITENNVDTDQILPKQFLTGIDKQGYGKHLFHDWRYLDDYEKVPNPDFVLNKPPFNQAKILLAGDNFGCGSSREHAPWAIKDFGIDIVMSTSFADIFFNNCVNNAIVPVVISTTEFDQVVAILQNEPACPMHVDVEKKILNIKSLDVGFELTDYQHKALTRGLDEISQTLQFEADIKAYEESSFN